MIKADNYEVSDSLWGRATQYASAVWDSWDKDVDEYVEDVMDTDSRSDDELYASTVLQDSAHTVELVAHLVGSVISNDYTKERAKELGEAIASTDTYKSTSESIEDLEIQLTQATDSFLKEHPSVNDVLQSTDTKLEEMTTYVVKEAQDFATNHPELTHDFKSIVEIAATVPAVKVGKVAVRATENIGSISTLKYLDKAQKHPIEMTTPTGKDLQAWQNISQEHDSSGASNWIWDKHMEVKGLDTVIKEKSFENVEIAFGVQGAEKLGYVLGQKTEFVQISSNGTPLGMMLIAKDYKTNALEESSGFVWYLQGGSKDYLDSIGMDKKEFDVSIGAALLDTASVKSLEAGKSGHVLLHADPSGGDGLLKYYEKQDYKQVGQENHSNITGVGAFGRENDGRYFHQDDTNSQSYLTQNREKIGQENDLTLTSNLVTFSKTDIALAAASTIALSSEVSEAKEQSNNLDQEVLEERIDKMNHETLTQVDVQDNQSNTPIQEEFDSTEKAINLADEMLRSKDVGHENTQGIEINSEINDLNNKEEFDSTAKAQEIIDKHYPVNTNYNDMDRGVERD